MNSKVEEGIKRIKRESKNACEACKDSDDYNALINGLIDVYQAIFDRLDKIYKE